MTKPLNKQEVLKLHNYFYDDSVKYLKWFKFLFILFLISSLFSLSGSLFLISLTILFGTVATIFFIYVKSCEIRADIYLNSLTNYNDD